MEQNQPKSQKLSKKQKGFVKDYVETGNGVQSALNNYDTTDYSTAGNIASENLNKPNIQLAIAERLPDDLLEKKHLELLNAVNLEKLTFTALDSDEDIREIISKLPGYTLLYIKDFTNSDGKVVDRFAYVKAPDNTTQDKALDKAYKIKGLYTTDDSEKPKEKSINTYNIFFSPEVQQEVKTIESRIKEMLKKPNV